MPEVPMSYTSVNDLQNRIYHRQSAIKRGAFLETYAESFENDFFNPINQHFEVIKKKEELSNEER